MRHVLQSSTRIGRDVRTYISEPCRTDSHASGSHFWRILLYVLASHNNRCHPTLGILLVPERVSPIQAREAVHAEHPVVPGEV